MCLARFKRPRFPNFSRPSQTRNDRDESRSRLIPKLCHPERDAFCLAKGPLQLATTSGHKRGFHHNSEAPHSGFAELLLIDRVRLYLQIIEQLQIGILLVVAVERLQVAYRRAGLRHSEIVGQRVG